MTFKKLFRFRNLTRALMVLFACLYIVTPVRALDNTPTPVQDIVDPKFLLEVNPLTYTEETGSSTAQNFINGVANVVKFDSPAHILNAALLVLFPLAGLIVFIMLLWGGFEMFTGAFDEKATESGRQRITAAIIGFVLLFCSYWIAQVVGYIFGVNILG